MNTKNPLIERLYNGIIKENPTVVLMLGMCPTLATTTSLENGFGMGISATAVLILSNLLANIISIADFSFFSFFTSMSVKFGIQINFSFSITVSALYQLI